MHLSILRSLILCVFMLSLAMLGACKKPEYPACKKDKHCKVDEGETCVDGLCQQCKTDEECKGKGPEGQDWVCHEFRCADPSTIGDGGPGSKGSPCAQTSECSGGLVCKAGKCDNCADDIECEGGTCNSDTGLCELTEGGQCQTDDDCSMDEICDGGQCVFSGITEGEGGNPCELEAVYFGFDSPKIENEAAEQLNTAAECIKSENRLVYLEAHADPRGTEEYNIMLTDKRGNTVKKYLADLGVTREHMQVISKGDLEASGTDDASWAKDRRVQFIWP